MVVDEMEEESWKQRLPSQSDHLPYCDLVPLAAFAKVMCMTLWFEMRDLMIAALRSISSGACALWVRLDLRF